MQTTNSNWISDGNFQPRLRSAGDANWSGHLPFARDLLVATQPKLFVELDGCCEESYFGFCQAIAENNINCLSYAVSGWTDAPGIGVNTFQNVRDYNEAYYRSFSHLLRSTFEEALPQFADASIDILHLGGSPSYQSVSHNSYSWIPKVRPGGFILLNNIVARASGLETWKLWSELGGYGRQFEFRHNGGLGVLEKAGGEATGILNSLFEGDERQRKHIRRFYSLCAAGLELEAFSEQRAKAERAQAAHTETLREVDGLSSLLVAERQRSTQLLEERDAVGVEKESALSELHKARAKTYVLETNLREAKKDLDTARTEFIEGQIALDTLKNSHRDLQHRYTVVNDRLTGILRSQSWRITAPLRKVTERLHK